MPGKVTCHMRRQLPAVDDGRLVQLGLDLGQRGQEDDGAPTHLLPDALQDDQGFEEVRVGHDVEGVDALIAQHLVDEAGPAKDLLPQGDDDDPRQEVGQVDDALQRALEARVHDAVEHQRQEQRRGEREEQLQQLDLHRVDEGELEVGIGEQPTEVLEADEGLPPMPRKGEKS